jgi:hypothetical protein
MGSAADVSQDVEQSRRFFAQQTHAEPPMDTGRDHFVLWAL